MATGRIHRLLKLIMLLQTKSGRTVSELLDALEISRRTLFRDLKELEAAGIPYYHDRDKGYRIVENFHLPPIQMSVSETLALVTLAQSADHRHRLDDMQQQALGKVVAAIPTAIRQACEMLVSGSPNDGDTPAISAHDVARLETFRQAQRDGHALRVVYDEPGAASAVTFHFAPLDIQQGRNAPYLLGTRNDDDTLVLLTLNRIREMHPTPAND